MKTCGEMRSNLLMPGVTVKSRINFDRMDPSNQSPLSKAYIDARNALPPPLQPPNNNKEIQNIPQSYKGFYTWLSSPKTILNNRKMNNVAVIAPNQHQM